MARKTKLSAVDKFLKAFGRGDAYRRYKKEDDSRLTDRIPEVMHSIVKKEGWCSYKDQVLWLCDPDDWKPAARAWLSDVKNGRVLARTAFGDLWIWDGMIFRFVMVHESLVMESVDDADWFFSQVLTDKELPVHTTLPERVRAARKKVGSLEWDEIYTYVPALGLGGSVKSSRVERVKALEAITSLAELTTIRRI